MEIKGPPINTATGALLNHITASPVEPFTPSNIHFGLFPAFEAPGRKRIGKKEKKELVCKAAMLAFNQWKQEMYQSVGII